MRIITSIYVVLRAAKVDVSELIKAVDNLEKNGTVKRHGEKYKFKADDKSSSLSITRGTRIVSDASNWSDRDFVAAKFAGWHSLLNQAEDVGGTMALTELPVELKCLAKLFPVKEKEKEKEKEEKEPTKEAATA